MLTLDQKDELQCGEETPSPASVRQPEPAPPSGSMYSEEEERNGIVLWEELKSQGYSGLC